MYPSTITRESFQEPGISYRNIPDGMLRNRMRREVNNLDKSKSLNVRTFDSHNIEIKNSDFKHDEEIFV
jgi:hypothetical protein